MQDRANQLPSLPLKIKKSRSALVLHLYPEASNKDEKLMNDLLKEKNTFWKDYIPKKNKGGEEAFEYFTHLWG